MTILTNTLQCIQHASDSMNLKWQVLGHSTMPPHDKPRLDTALGAETAWGSWEPVLPPYYESCMQLEYTMLRAQSLICEQAAQQPGSPFIVQGRNLLPADAG